MESALKQPAKRGRPRKEKIDTDVVKRGRGRPRKVIDNENVQIKKRKRGRPRKEREVVSSSSVLGNGLLWCMMSSPSPTINTGIVYETIIDDNIKEEAVVRFELCGKLYLRCEDVLFDINTRDPIGIWDEAKQYLITIEEED